MAHWISSKPGLEEFQRQGLELCIKAKEDLALLLERRQRLVKLVNSIDRKGQKQCGV